METRQRKLTLKLASYLALIWLLVFGMSFGLGRVAASNAPGASTDGEQDSKHVRADAVATPAEPWRPQDPVLTFEDLMRQDRELAEQLVSELNADNLRIAGGCVHLFPFTYDKKLLYTLRLRFRAEPDGTRGVSHAAVQSSTLPLSQEAQSCLAEGWRKLVGIPLSLPTQMAVTLCATHRDPDQIMSEAEPGPSPSQ